MRGFGLTLGAACCTLAILLAGFLVAVAVAGSGGDIVEAGRPTGCCPHWELVPLDVPPRPGEVEPLLPVALIDRRTGRTWLFAHGPAGPEWQPVPRRENRHP